MRCSKGVAVWALVLVVISGCDDGRDGPPRVTLDGAIEGDAGSGGDDCETLGEVGACAGTVARWCEDGTLREERCEDAGQVCGTVSARHRCTEPPPPECEDPTEQEQLRITNEERVGAGLGPLTCDPGLTRAARLHSQDMCDQDYFEHDSLDGRTFRDRIDAQGVRWRTIGENIAWGHRTPAEVHEAWMDSDGHRANIMNADFGRIGIGYVACGGRPYWTQDFAD